MQSAYFVIYHVKHKKNTISRSFNLISKNPRWRPRWRSLLVTSEVTSSATTHIICLSLVKKIKGFPPKVKSFRNTATYKKFRRRGSIHPPLPPCTTVGVWICLYVRGLKNELKVLEYIQRVWGKWSTRAITHFQLWFSRMLWESF